MAKIITRTLSADGDTTGWGFVETTAQSTNTQTIVLSGTFGSGTTKVQISPDNEY
jgi:hypothetical protein